MKTFLQNAKRWLPGAIISITLIVVILQTVDVNEVIVELRKANRTFIIIAGILSAIWLMVRGIVWRPLLQNRPSYRDTFISLGEGYLLNSILPFRLGEFGKAFLLSQKSDLSFTEILPTIIVERIFDLIISAALLVIAVPYIAGAEGTAQIGYIIGSIVLFAVIMLYIIAQNQAWALNLFNKLTARIPKVQAIGGKLVASLLAGLSVFTNGWLFLRFLFWITLNWGIAVLQYTLIISAFLPEATPIWGMFGLGLAAFGNAVPSLPSGAGTLDAAIIFAVKKLSDNVDAAGGVAIIVRLYKDLFTTIIGLYGLNTEGETLSGIYQKLKSLQNKSV